MKRKVSNSYVPKKRQLCVHKNPKKRNREETIIEQIINFMQTKHLYLTKSKNFVFNSNDKSLIPLKKFVFDFLIQFNLFNDQIYLHDLQICADMKLSKDIRRLNIEVYKPYWITMLQTI